MLRQCRVIISQITDLYIKDEKDIYIVLELVLKLLSEIQPNMNVICNIAEFPNDTNI